jgi:hypothetical protein
VRCATVGEVSAGGCAATGGAGAATTGAGAAATGAGVATAGASLTTVTTDFGAGRLSALTAGAGAAPSLLSSAGLLMTRKPKTPANMASAMAQAAMARRMALSQTLRRYQPGAA